MSDSWNRLGLVGIPACLLLASLVAFWPALDNGFVNMDDETYVLDNPHVTRGLAADGIVWAWTQEYAAMWQPVTWMSHMLDWELYEASPAGHHLTSLLLHLANTLLLFLLLARVTEAPWPSGFVAALFAVHPLHVESVVWIAGRKDVVSTLFWLLAMLAYVRFARRRSVAAYALVMAALFLGLASKPMLVTLPVVLLAFDFWPLGRWPEGVRGGWAVVREKLPLLALSAAGSVVAVVVQQSGRALRSLEQFPLSARVSNAIVSYVAYLWKTVWPFELAAFYPHPGETLAGWQVGGALLILIGVTALTIRLRRRAPYLLVGWLWYVITLLPVIGLVQVGTHAMADRYSYVPLIGILVMVGWGVPAALVALRGGGRLRPALGVVATLVVVALLPLTRAQVRTWRDSETLFRHALAVTSDNAKAHNGLGAALARRGRTEEAIAEYSAALRIEPRFPRAQNNLGVALAGQGRHAEAETRFRAALRNEAREPQIHVNLGNALQNQGRFDEAYRSFADALEIDPRFAEAHYNLGVALARQGQPEEAIVRYSRALELDPDNARCHNNLGNALAQSGRAAEAIAHYSTALELSPGYARAHANLAAALFFEGRLAEAWAEVRAARRLGFEPPEALIRSLAEAMPEPDR